MIIFIYLAMPAPPAFADAVGDVHQFFQKNHDTQGYESVSARCRNISAHAALYVDTNIGSDKTAEDQLTAFFETQVVPAIRDKYGDPPDVDKDSLEVLLFTRVTDSSNVYKAFFDQVNEHDPAEAGYSNSNQREIIYIDYDYFVHQSDETKRQIGAAYVEMVAWNYCPDKMQFLVQGLAQYSCLVVQEGYPISFLQAYSNTCTSLFSSRITREFLGKCFLFMKYLKDNFDPQGTLLKTLTQTKEKSGRTAIESALGKKFDDLYLSFSQLIFTKANDYFQKCCAVSYFDFPIQTTEILLKSYEPIGIRMSPFWPDCSLFLENFTGKSSELRGRMLFFRNDVLYSYADIQYDGGAQFSPPFDFQANETVLILMNCPEQEADADRTLKILVSFSEHEFTYLSNPILREQIFLFFKVRDQLSGLSLTDPAGTVSSYQLTSLDAATYYSAFTAIAAGRYIATVAGEDANHNPISRSYQILVGADELDSNQIY